MAILKVPSTITTTLAPTSSERILEVMVDGSLAWPLAACLTEPRPPLASGGAAAAAWAARRAAAMKLEVLTGALGLAGIPLMAFSEAAIRSVGEAARAVGRVPGSSGWSGGRSGSIATRGCVGTRISLMAFGAAAGATDGVGAEAA